MLSSQLLRREALLSRSTAALDRWPNRSGQDFSREMTAVAKGLQSLAEEVDAENGNKLERSRNWRHTGNAYFDLADAKNQAFLNLAADAYRKSEALLAEIDNPMEQMKLNYSFGHTLFHLSEGKNFNLLQDARHRYALALELASTIMPAGIASAKEALANADRLIGLLGLSENMGQRIDELREEKKYQEARDTGTQGGAFDFQTIFGKLMDEYNANISAGKVSDTRQQAIDPILSELGKIVTSDPAEAGENQTKRSRIGDLASRMQHLLSDTGQDASIPEGSRADKVWNLFSKFKLFLSNELMRPHIGKDEHSYGMQLYKECGHADTYLHKQALNDEVIAKYETDLLRQLATEVRTYSLRNHLTLISPVWSTPGLPKNPNAVFFSGSDSLKKVVEAVCSLTKLNLFSSALPREYGSDRWDQLRSCHVAVFDFTGYQRQIFDAEIDNKTNSRIFSISYELGIALTLGRPVVVIANEGQSLPFDVDIGPVRIKNDAHDIERIADAIDNVIYGLQRGGGKSSIASTYAYLNKKFLNSGNFIIEQSLKLIDDSATRDPVRFRRLIEPILGTAGPGHHKWYFHPGREIILSQVAGVVFM